VYQTIKPQRALKRYGKGPKKNGEYFQGIFQAWRAEEKNKRGSEKKKNVKAREGGGASQWIQKRVVGQRLKESLYR